MTSAASRSLAHRIRRRDNRRRAVERAREQVHLRLVELGPPGPFMDFIPRVSPMLWRPEHMPELCDSIERGVDFDGGGGIRECFSYPVRHGKTSTVHHAPAYILRHDPTRAVLYLTYAHGFARKQTSRMRDIAERAGVRLGSTRRKDEWTTAAGGFVKGVGIGGQLTGEGFTDVIVDDLHKNRAEAESRMIREGAIEALFNDVMTRRDPRGFNMWVLGARWNVNDVIGVLTRMEKHPFKRHNRPALDENNNPLAPRLFSREQLEELRDTLGPYVWASLYQGNPRPRSGALFKDATYTAERSVPSRYRIAIGLDLAWSKRTRADHNAAVVLRRNLDSNIFDVLEAQRARGLIMDHVAGRVIVDEGFARVVVRLLHEHPEATLWMYAADNEGPLVQLFERILRDADPDLGPRATINVLPITKDKHARAQPYAVSWNGGRVRIPGRSQLSTGEGRRRREADHLETEEQDEWRNRDGWQHQFVVEHHEFTGADGEENDQVDAAVAAHDGLSDGQGTSLVEAMGAYR